MERRVAERSWQLSTLLDLAFLVSHPENPENIFLPALERLVDISSLDAVCIHIYSNDKQYLRLEAQVGLEADEADLMQLSLPSGLFAAWLSQPKDALIFSGLKLQVIPAGYSDLTDYVPVFLLSLSPGEKCWAC